ncbi:methyl-accepting chemotaxis protein [Haloarcula sp. AONF1]
MTSTDDSTGPLGRLMLAVGTVPMTIEPYLPTPLRRTFSARVFLLAAMSIVGAPALAIVLFSSVTAAAVFIGFVVAVTGFLGYCEMYRAIIEINRKATAVDNGQYDIDFGVDRIDEVGDAYTKLERAADSLGQNIREANEAQERAEEAREAAEEARETAESERSEMEALSSHLELKATQYRTVLDDAAAGDLTARVDTDSISDAMAAVGTAINETLAALETAIGSGQSTATRIATGSETVLADGQQVRDETQSVADTASNIADGAETQRQQLDDAASELSDLSATVEEMASSVAQIADQSNTAADLGRDAQRSSSEAQSAVDEIRHHSTSAASEVQQLDDIAEDMAEIVEVIDGIAEETNMLALNASIEAARAGQAGSGFAVVADEIKQLATETQAATGDVEDLIASLRSQVGTSVDAMETMEDAVDRGSNTISETITTLEDVVDATVDVNGGIQEIDRATDQQATSAQEVVRIIDDINDIAGETATDARGMATTVDQQGQTVAGMVDSVERFADDADTLHEELSQFDTAGTDDVDTPASSGSAMSD